MNLYDFFRKEIQTKFEAKIHTICIWTITQVINTKYTTINQILKDCWIHISLVNANNSEAVE